MNTIFQKNYLVGIFNKMKNEGYFFLSKNIFFPAFQMRAMFMKQTKRVDLYSVPLCIRCHPTKGI